MTSETSISEEPTSAERAGPLVGGPLGALGGGPLVGGPLGALGGCPLGLKPSPLKPSWAISTQDVKIDTSFKLGRGGMSVVYAGMCVRVRVNGLRRRVSGGETEGEC